MISALLLALQPACSGAAALGKAQVVEISAQHPRQIAIGDAGCALLLEEVGADLEYRWSDNEAFVPIETPPARLGFDIVQPRSTQLTLRTREGQGGGRARLTPCLAPPQNLFFTQLAAYQRLSLRSGGKPARAALPPLQLLRQLPADALQQAWLDTAYANLLLSAGDISGSLALFRQTAQEWQAAGRDDRAAIALMAAGENLSRLRSDQADSVLTQAGAALRAQGLGYYALRTEAAQCTLLSRRGHYQPSMACEERVLVKMLAQAEYLEAATRQVSLGNQLLRDAQYPRAYALFRQAQARAPLMTRVVRSRLESGFGSYYLYTGELPLAAAHFAQAARTLDGSGLPADQTLIDFKLAGIAAFAGAGLERRRLLEHLAATLGDEAQPRLAEVRIALARLQREAGDAAGAQQQAAGAAQLCSQLGDDDCLLQARLVEIDSLLDQSLLPPAIRLWTSLPGSDVRSLRLAAAIVHARLELARHGAAAALAALPAAAALREDPELEARQARLAATALQRQGKAQQARETLLQVLLTQAERAGRWPSAALRVSARNRLADLQSALFETLLASTPGGDLPEGDLAQLSQAITAAGVHRLFREDAVNELPGALRASLSAAAGEDASIDPRMLFSALAQGATPPGALPAAAAAPMPRPAFGADERVLLPLLGDSRFALLAWDGGSARICRQMPRSAYEQLATRFELALEGADTALAELHATAQAWEASVQACLPATARRWTVVSLPGVRPLPWAWIAAATPAPSEEPTVTVVFDLAPVRAMPPLPRSAVLLDLDMPGNNRLPFAPVELQSMQQLFARQGISARLVRGTDTLPGELLQLFATTPVLHVIGHANPAGYGQLYQGLWFERHRKPVLLTYPEIAAARSRAQLVVLSACGTTVAAQQSFGATSRLPEAFIAAGALQVVASSNAASDAAAPLWTRALHEELWRSGDLALAAQAARRALRESRHFRHPKYWAGLDAYAATRR